MGESIINTKSERWTKLQELFNAALRKEPEDRNDFILQACGGDNELYREVLSLLAADENSNSSILEGVAIDAFNTSFFEDSSGTLSAEGKQIGQYRLLERIALGGMGAVYLAERTDGQFEHKVAVKLIKPGMDSEQIIRRFRNERQILASLDHPNIARLYDGGLIEKNLPYFTMEYVDGEPIDIYCLRKKLNIKERLKLFQTVCEAVQYAHRNLVIHRDLKPGNILVTAEGTVKLLDFGIAKVFGSEEEIPQMTALTQPGLKVMTPEYASPEQVQGKTVTTSTDVYSLGLILYRLLTFSHPFDFSGKTNAEIEKMICEITPTRPSAALRIENPQIPESNEQIQQNLEINYKKLKRELRGDLDTICLMALRKEPQRRYSSPEQMQEDIQRYLSGRPINALRDSILYRSKKFTSRHKASVIAAIVSFIIINFLVVFYTIQLASERDRARLEAEKSAQVSDFLIKLFEVSDPSQSKGETITARELLESGTSRIDSELSKQPGVQAELYNVVGKVYMSLGFYAKSQKLLEKSISINENITDGDNIGNANTNDLLGTLYHLQGEYETSLKYYDNALRIHQELNMEQIGEKSAVVFNKASVVHDMGNYSLADSLYRKSIEMRKEVFGKQSNEVAESMTGLAKLLNDQADYQNSEIMYTEALNIKRNLLGDLHPSVTQTMVDLGYLFEVLGRWSESEKLFRDALELDKKMLGEDHPYITSNWFSLGSLLHSMGKFDEAEYYLKKALDGDVKNLGMDHPYVALDQNNLAGVMNAKGNVNEAKSLYTKALKLQKRVLGQNHPEVATTTSNLGMVFLKKGQLDSAEIYSRKALEIRKNILGEEHPHISISMNHLANVYLQMKDYKRAGELYVAALEMQKRLMGEESQRLVVPMLSLAAFKVETGDTTEAENILRRSVKIAKKTFPADHPTISNTLYELGELLTNIREYNEAETILRKSLKMRNAIFDTDHNAVIDAKTQLGKCLFKKGNFSESEKLLLENFSIVQQKQGKQKRNLAQQIIKMYAKWNKPNQAEEFEIYLN